MKKNRLHWFVLLLALILSEAAIAQYGGGTGTLIDPYLISTPAHLNNVRNNLSSHFKLTANVDLNVAPYNTGTGWTPIGDHTAPFTGSLDGNNFSVQNLYISSPTFNEQGLFGAT